MVCTDNENGHWMEFAVNPVIDITASLVKFPDSVPTIIVW